MRHRETRWKVDRVLIAAAFSLMAAMGCHFTWGNPQLIDTGLPECPKSGVWSTRFVHLKSDSNGQGNGNPTNAVLLSVAGGRTDIPEYHDCQQFISYKGNDPSYLSLFAVFSRDNLGDSAARFDTVVDTAKTSGDSSVAARAGYPLAVGEIYAIDSGYAPLGVASGFNCLFLYGQIAAINGLEAKVVPVGKNEGLCATIGDPRSVTGTILEVHRHRFGPREVPDVARWDWDSTHKQQTIGIGCGSGWCDIGAPGFTPSMAHRPAITTSNDRVLAVKGWYDEQLLAYPVHGSMAKPRVSDVVGTLVAAPGLMYATADSFKAQWKTVAAVAIASSDVYMKKLNLAPSSITHMTDSVYLCNGADTTCIPRGAAISSKSCAGSDKRWWARITSQPSDNATDGGGSAIASPKTTYYCVTRRTHTGMFIPGVVRWRWDIKDETMWISCVQGCCEVEAGDS